MKPSQFSFTIRSHGGAREGAGRPRLKLHDPTHEARPRLNLRTAFHATLRMVAGVPSLRDERFLKEFNRAIERAKGRGLYVNHFAIEKNHIHFMGETENNDTLTRGLLSLQGCLVWALRRIFDYFGRVFEGRFHLHALKSPREVRNALLYVIFNHSKHCGVQRFADIFSSAFAFEDLSQFVRNPGRPPRWQAEINRALSAPRSWLQTKGWKRTQ